MALGITTVERANDVGEQPFLIFTDGSTRRIQTFAFVDEDGAHAGIAGNPFIVSVESGPVRWKYDTAGAAEAGAQLRTGAGDIRELRALLDPSVVAVRYLMLFDLAAPPTLGAVPDWRGLIPAAGEMSESFPGGEFAFTLGCYAMISTTLPTLTVSAADGFFHVRGLEA
jgi:hypothetical protein